MSEDDKGYGKKKRAEQGKENGEGQRGWAAILNSESIGIIEKAALEGSGQRAMGLSEGRASRWSSR